MYSLLLLFDLGWFIVIRVDGTGYLCQGLHLNYTYASVVATYVSPTRTVITVDAGPVRANLTYLTPIELNDWTLHTLPFAYLAIDLWSIDGNSHAVQIYSDVAGQFVSSNPANILTWNTTLTSKLIYHQAQQSTIRLFMENNDMSEDGAQYFAFATTPGVAVTWLTADSETGRVGFSTNGKLTNTSDTKYRAINDAWPVMAFSLELGNITQTSNSLVFALGLVRDPVLTYITSDGSQNRNPLWSIRWKNVGDAIDDFLSGFPSALSRAIAVDNKITSDASTTSSTFNLPSAVAMGLTDLVTLNLRQTIGSLELTTSSQSNGQLSGMEDLRVFMKDVGNSRRVNPVEMIYASFPAFLYLNASLAGALLEPLLEFQTSPSYSKEYAAPDLGSTWPSVQINNTDQSGLAIENCGSMLIMALAHTQKSGDGRLIHTYYNLLSKWADFLVQNSLGPSGYTTSDGLVGHQTPNLVLKGITGIYAMGKINQILEQRGADPKRTLQYLTTARNYTQQWQNLAFAPDHAVSTYGDNSTWSLLYNLYAPRLIGADIIPNNIYETQAMCQPFVKAHWTLLTAGSIFNITTGGARDALISTVHSRAFMRNKASPNPSMYKADDGTVTAGQASPAVGAAFALLALTLPDVTPTLPAGSVSTGSVSGILGGIFGAILVFLGLFVWLRKRREREGGGITPNVAPSEQQSPMNTSPFVTPFIFEPSTPEPNHLRGFEPPTANSDGMTPASQSGTRRPSPHEKRVLFRPQTDSLLRGHDSMAGNSVSGGSSSHQTTSTPVQSASQDTGLRRELDELRIQMETLRGQQQAFQPPQEVPIDPPPMYFNETDSDRGSARRAAVESTQLHANF
ncbi:hypothetical protein BU17DRAFT_66217 [Hysterangium stoloniferum]|nr:hypothetical protein BU17DRAFT_66217 [Hysterangium stoloniferum]